MKVDNLNEAGHFVRATIPTPRGKTTKVVLISGSKTTDEAHRRARAHYEKRGHAVLGTEIVKSAEAHSLMAKGKLRPTGLEEEITHIIRSSVIDKAGVNRTMITPVKDAPSEEQAHAIAKQKLESQGHKVVKMQTLGAEPKEKSYVPPPGKPEDPYGYGMGRYMGDSVEFSFDNLKSVLGESVKTTLLSLLEKKQPKKEKDKDSKKKDTKKVGEKKKTTTEKDFPTVDLEPELGTNPGMANSTEGDDNESTENRQPN